MAVLQLEDGKIYTNIGAIASQLAVLNIEIDRLPTNENLTIQELLAQDILNVTEKQQILTAFKTEFAYFKRISGCQWCDLKVLHPGSQQIYALMTQSDRTHTHADAEVIRYTSDPAFKSLEDAKYLIENTIRKQYSDYGYGRWAVIEKVSGEFTGWCGIKFMMESGVADGRPAAPTEAAVAPAEPQPGEALLATWHWLLDDGSLQDGEPHLAGTAKQARLHLSPATATELGAQEGDPVTVSTDRGSITLPLVLADLPDRVVWLPTRSPDAAVRRDLAAVPGDVVRLSRGTSR